MKHTLILFAALFLATSASDAFAQPKEKTTQPPAKKDPAKDDKTPAKDDGKLPHTKLLPAKVVPNVCLLKYPASTSSPECQALINQGLGYYYSYVYMEAARSFETATKHDPNCAIAWWGLSKACERWGRVPYAPPLKKAQDLMAEANEREQRLIKARLQEKGMIEGVKVEDRKKEAVKILDELLTLHDDDEEAWFARAQVAEGPNSAVPFYKALLRINPIHPGANHELVHHYENIRRPALGWPHAEKYIESSPGIPHAFHMQAHLGMRIGKWSKSTDWSLRAIEIEEAYQKDMKVLPSEDAQFSHHLETLMQALLHDGRYKEANLLRKKCEGYKFTQRIHWFRLALAERNWTEALVQANLYGKDKVMTSYLRALVYLNKGELERALPEINVLRESFLSNRLNKELELCIFLVQGLYQCSIEGGGSIGVKMLSKTVERTKDDYGRHAWGHGAYHMEYWGIGALKANRFDQAEEAFLEALAHDAGSVKAALGMHIVCERQGRTEEATRFAELAQRCWRKADPGLIQAELDYMRSLGTTATTSVGAKR